MEKKKKNYGVLQACSARKNNSVKNKFTFGTYRGFLEIFRGRLDGEQH